MPDARRVRGFGAVVLGVLALVAASCSSGSTRAADEPTTATSGAKSGSTGCGRRPPVTATRDAVGDVPLAFDSGGVGRTYRLGIPRDYDRNRPSPVVLDLHGATSSAAQMSVYSGLPAAGTKRGFIVVTPDALDGRWERSGAGADDVFLTALLDDVAAHYCVDLDRVHAAGISLGSWKTTITACTHPDRFASIALVAENVAPGGCAIPVVAFHGTADHAVPYGEGGDPGVVVTGANAALPGVRGNMAAWARNNGCDPTPKIVRIEPDVDHWTFTGCDESRGAEFYSVIHGDHTWPGSAIERPGTTQTIDATAIALDWFRDHPRPESP